LLKRSSEWIFGGKTLWAAWDVDNVVFRAATNCSDGDTILYCGVADTSIAWQPAYSRHSGDPIANRHRAAGSTLRGAENSETSAITGS
jgi:predicted GH43/DUF377 family glycosyl hydrolase